MSLVLFAFLSCAEEKPGSGDLIDFIPADAALILKLEDPDLFFSNLKNNEFFKKNSSHPLQKSLKKQLSFLNYFSHEQASLLNFSIDKNQNISYSFISEGIPNIKDLDTVKNRSVETFTIGAGEIKKYSLGDLVAYTTAIDSVFIVSDSRETLENSIENSDQQALPSQADFEKALKAASDKNATIFINHRKLPAAFKEIFPLATHTTPENFSNWTSLDTEISQTSIKLNGITSASDTLPHFINLFKGVPPTANELASLSPDDSYGFFSFTFRDFLVLKKNLESYNQKNLEMNSREGELLATASEAGMIYLEHAEVFAVNSHNVEAAELSIFTNELAEEYRGTKIYQYSDTGKFNSLLHPLVSVKNIQYFLSLNEIFLFSEETGPLKEIIRNVQNETTLAHRKSYLSSMENLSTEASVLLVSNNNEFQSRIAQIASPEFKKTTQNLSFEQFPLAALQFIYDTNFAHVHAVLKKTEGKSDTKGVKQATAVNLDAPLALPPVFFNNHRTKGLDIAVQDKQNTLYLISEKGEIYWKKKLDTRILEKIQQVDLFKNGRIQLAFATQNAIHVIDRVGNNVKPFPLKFKDEITQPLAIFDYSNTRDYRFMFVQDKEVFMLNRKGQRIKGFKFSKSKSEIVQPPKHIRLGNKDYILIGGASGKLNILNRTGNIRIPVKEQIEFSENEWFEYNNAFISTNKQGELVKIAQNGKITKENLHLAENHQIDATAKTLVALSENTLSIKGKKVTLDYGLYSQPQIFYINNKLYISVTDTQAHRVFLFDSNAELLPNFPVYGNSAIDLGNADGDVPLEFVVQGDDDSLLLYEITE